MLEQKLDSITAMLNGSLFALSEANKGDKDVPDTEAKKEAEVRKAYGLEQAELNKKFHLNEVIA